MKLKSFLPFIALMLFSFTSVAQFEKAASDIQQIMKDYPVVGISVAVVKDGKMIYTHSFGLKNVENNVPLTDESIFRIASISKSFTVTSLMQLVQKKKISLDDDVSKLVGFQIRNPKFPATVITLRMLLSHTSSINESNGRNDFNFISW